MPPRFTLNDPMLWAIAAFLLAAFTLVLSTIRLWLANRRIGRFESRLRSVEAHNRLLRQRLAGFDARDRVAAAGRAPRHPIEFDAPHGADAFLWELFDRRIDGFYLEAGAYDGRTRSISYPFEAIGWTGILIEPNPERYKACVAQRPGSLVAQTALSRTGPDGGGAGKTAKLLIPLDTPEADRAAVVLKPDAPAREPRPNERLVPVTLSTIDECIAAAGPEARGQQIQFAVIDVNGAEIEVLDGFNLEQHRPRAILVRDFLPRDQPSPGAYLARRHYQPAASIGKFTVYLRSDEPALIARAAAITQAA